MFSVIAMDALFGLSLPISKILLQYAPPFFLSGIRMFIAGIILLAFNYFRGSSKTKANTQLKTAHIYLYAQIIFFGVYLKYILRYWGLSHMSSIKLSFLLNMSPFMAAFFSYLAFSEKLTKKQWIGILIGFLGLIPVLLVKSGGEATWGELFFISWPEIAIIAAVASHCYGMIIARKLIKHNNYSSSMTNGIRMFGGGVLALLTAFMFEGFFPVTDVVPFAGWLALLLVLSNIICHNMYLQLLRKYSVTFLSFTDFLIPLFTAFYGWAFLHEAITWHYVVSTPLVFAGLYLFYQDELGSIKAEKKIEKTKVA